LLVLDLPLLNCNKTIVSLHSYNTYFVHVIRATIIWPLWSVQQQLILNSWRIRIKLTRTNPTTNINIQSTPQPKTHPINTNNQPWTHWWNQSAIKQSNAAIQKCGSCWLRYLCYFRFSIELNLDQWIVVENVD